VVKMLPLRLIPPARSLSLRCMHSLDLISQGRASVTGSALANRDLLAVSTMKMTLTLENFKLSRCAGLPSLLRQRPGPTTVLAYCLQEPGTTQPSRLCWPWPGSNQDLAA
jgi:hypothetical protein